MYWSRAFLCFVGDVLTGGALIERRQVERACRFAQDQLGSRGRLQTSPNARTWATPPDLLARRSLAWTGFFGVRIALLPRAKARSAGRDVLP